MGAVAGAGMGDEFPPYCGREWDEKRGRKCFVTSGTGKLELKAVECGPHVV